MMNKKIASVFVAGAMVMAMGTTPAFAATATTPSVCTTSSCTQTGNHQHNGKTYAAHTTGDGHTYHTNCGVSGCTKTGSHTSHNGSHNGNGSGHGSHKSGGHHG
ncbi:MAG: hypothetical protein PHE09_17625 [Oscillospiraceae bacterium]|nr:hypothetical protein [Oscillospiraceae bacterium]